MKRKVNKKQCEKCGDSFHPGIMYRHTKYCKGVKKEIKEPLVKLDNKWLMDNGKYKCPYCNKEYTKMGICSHIIFKHLNYKNNNLKTFMNDIKNGKIQHPNKGKKLSDEQKLKISLKTIGRVHSIETRKKISESVKGKTGGIRINGGRGKKGWYKGFWCDSSWELAFVIYNLDLGNKITRNKEYFIYDYKGKEYKYYPDFIVNNEYVEIKGYEDNKAKEKKKQFPHKINTFYLEEIQIILNYVVEKYGKNFIKMYEKN